MAYSALFMYIRNEILENGLNSCSLCSYGCIMVKALLVDIYINMCQDFSSESRICVSRVSFQFTRKVVSLSFTPCAHLA